MKIIYSALLCGALCICLSLSTTAQKLTKKFSVGFGLEAGIPTGDIKNAYNAAGGVTVRFAYHAGPGFVTLTTGGVFFIPKDLDADDIKVGALIPVKAGYKYIIGDHFFVMGEVGYSSFGIYSEGPNDELQSESWGGFTYAPGIGVQFNVLEIGLRYETLKVTNGNVSYLGARVGFNF